MRRGLVLLAMACLLWAQSDRDELLECVRAAAAAGDAATIEGLVDELSALDRTVIPALSELLRSSDDLEVKAALVRVIGKLRTPTIDELRDRIESGDPATRLRAVLDLRRSDDREGLRALLEHPDADVVRAVEQALARLDGASPPLLHDRPPARNDLPVLRVGLYREDPDAGALPQGVAQVWAALRAREDACLLATRERISPGRSQELAWSDGEVEVKLETAAERTDRGFRVHLQLWVEGGGEQLGFDRSFELSSGGSDMVSLRVGDRRYRLFAGLVGTPQVAPVAPAAPPPPPPPARDSSGRTLPRGFSEGEWEGDVFIAPEVGIAGPLQDKYQSKIAVVELLNTFYATYQEMDDGSIEVTLEKLGPRSSISRLLGMRDGDVITAVNGRRMEGVKGVWELYDELKAVDAYELDFRRDGQQVRLPVRIER